MFIRVGHIRTSTGSRIGRIGLPGQPRDSAARPTAHPARTRNQLLRDVRWVHVSPESAAIELAMVRRTGIQVQVGCVRDSSGRALRATVSLQLVFQATKSWPTADAVILRAGGCHCASGSLGQSCKRDPIERSRTDDSDSVSVSTTAVGHAAT